MDLRAGSLPAVPPLPAQGLPAHAAVSGAAMVAPDADRVSGLIPRARREEAAVRT